MDSLILYWRRVASANDELYTLEAKKFEEAQKETASLRQTFKEQERKRRITDIGVGVGGTLLGILLGVLLK